MDDDNTYSVKVFKEVCHTLYKNLLKLRFSKILIVDCQSKKSWNMACWFCWWIKCRDSHT